MILRFVAFSALLIQSISLWINDTLDTGPRGGIASVMVRRRHGRLDRWRRKGIGPVDLILNQYTYKQIIIFLATTKLLWCKGVVGLIEFQAEVQILTLLISFGFHPRSCKHQIQLSHAPPGPESGMYPFSMQSKRKREGLDILRDHCHVIFDLAHTATCTPTIGGSLRLAS